MCPNCVHLKKENDRLRSRLDEMRDLAGELRIKLHGLQTSHDKMTIRLQRLTSALQTAGGRLRPSQSDLQTQGEIQP